MYPYSSSSSTTTTLSTSSSTTGSGPMKYFSFADDAMDTSSIAKTNIIIDGANVAWELARVKLRHYGGDTTLATGKIITTSRKNSDDMLIDDDGQVPSSSTVFLSTSTTPVTTVTDPNSQSYQPNGPDIDGIHSMMRFWIAHGHDVVTILPRSYEYRYPNLSSVYVTGQILFSPPGDDLFVITTAKQLDGFIITNDKYRKEALMIEETVNALEANRLREYLLYHCITYTFTVDGQPLVHPVRSLQAMQTERKQNVPSAAEFIKQYSMRNDNGRTVHPSSSLSGNTHISPVIHSSLPPLPFPTSSCSSSSSSNISSAVSSSRASPVYSTVNSNNTFEPILSTSSPAVSLSSMYTNNSAWINDLNNGRRTKNGNTSSTDDNNRSRSSSLTITTVEPPLRKSPIESSSSSASFTPPLPSLPSNLPSPCRQYILSFPERSIHRVLLHQYTEEIWLTIQYGLQTKSNEYTYGILPRIKQDQLEGKTINTDTTTIGIRLKDKENLLYQILESIVTTINSIQNRCLSSGQFMSTSQIRDSFILWDNDRYTYLRQGLEYLQKTT